jgi:diphthine-ammonia ligase
MKVVAAWSGGKDSAFATYKAIQQGFEVINLVTFMHNEITSNFHAIKSELLDAQAQAVGIPIVKQKTFPTTYERQFKKTLTQLKDQGAEGLITGDIYEVSQHEQGWLERVLGEIGLRPIRPLWQGSTLQIFKDYLKAGFEATVVRTKNEVLSKDWIGRELNTKFLDDLLKHGNVDPCGENGEYHTFVTNGPNFKNKIKLLETKKTVNRGFGHLDILRFEVLPKDEQTPK